MFLPRRDNHATARVSDPDFEACRLNTAFSYLEHCYTSLSPLATKHELLTISPNCLMCGKIICIQEGPGPCTFCGTPVLSKDQQLLLIAEAKRKRAEAAREKNRQMNKKSTAPMSSHGMTRYASKLSGSVVTDRADDWLGPAEWEEQQRKAEESRLAAEQHKEKLLDFQRTSAKRTTVIGKYCGTTLCVTVMTCKLIEF